MSAPTCRDVVPPRPALGDNPALLEAAVPAGARAAAVRARPRALGAGRAGRGGPTSPPRCAPSTRALRGALVVRHGSAATRCCRVRAGRAEVGAARVHVAADFGPVRPPPRPAASSRRSPRTGSSWCAPARRTPWRPGRVTNGAGDAVPGVHPVLPGLGRARLARAGRRAAGATCAGSRRTTAEDPRPERCPTGVRAARGRRGRPRSALGRRSSTSGLADYAERARPARTSTAPRRMSAHLKWGEIHPRTLLADLGAPRSQAEGAATFRNELAWREFYADVLFAPAGLRAGATSSPSSRRWRTTSPGDAASRRGGRAAPASRSSTPACASCAPRAGCTTGCG